MRQPPREPEAHLPLSVQINAIVITAVEQWSNIHSMVRRILYLVSMEQP